VHKVTFSVGWNVIIVVRVMKLIAKLQGAIVDFSMPDLFLSFHIKSVSLVISSSYDINALLQKNC